MLTLPSWALKAVAGILLAAGLIGGSLWYRSHVYDEGYAAGLTAEKQQHAKALDAVKASDKAASDKAQADLRTQLKGETDAHNARATALEAALVASRADGVRLSDQLASLHNDAVTGSRPSYAGNAASAVPQGPSAAPVVLAGLGQFTLSDLMLNDEANYTICRKNAAQLTALQDWYEAIRTGDRAGQTRAVADAPGE